MDHQQVDMFLLRMELELICVSLMIVICLHNYQASKPLNKNEKKVQILESSLERKQEKMLGRCVNEGGNNKEVILRGVGGGGGKEGFIFFKNILVKGKETSVM